LGGDVTANLYFGARFKSTYYITIREGFEFDDEEIY